MVEGCRALKEGREWGGVHECVQCLEGGEKEGRDGGAGKGFAACLSEDEGGSSPLPRAVESERPLGQRVRPLVFLGTVRMMPSWCKPERGIGE